MRREKRIVYIGVDPIDHVELSRVLRSLPETEITKASIDAKQTLIEEHKPFLISPIPRLDDVWIDPKEPVFNHSKHVQTCTKNRKKRKRLKRSRRRK